MHYFSNKFSKIAKRWGLSAFRDEAGGKTKPPTAGGKRLRPQYRRFLEIHHQNNPFLGMF